MNSLSRTQKPRAGFTLLEVMVVIVILGVLASLVVPNLLGNKEKADRQKAISDIVALENALDMYRLDNGREKGLFDVYTLGADGQENGEGAGADIGNWNLQEFQ